MGSRFIIFTAAIAAVVLSTALASPTPAPTPIRYDGWQVYLVVTAQMNANQMAAFNNFVAAYPKQLIWFYNRLVLPPVHQAQFSNLVTTNSLPVIKVWDDLQKQVLDPTVAGSSNGPHTWNSYQTIEDVYEFMIEQTVNHLPYVTPITAGYSYEGRPIMGLKISYGRNKYPRSIFIEATIHAVEWIAYESATFLIDQILNGNGPDVELLRNYDWYIFPIINPDGVAYTQKTNRIWRANRKPIDNSTCIGTDLNRNFGYRWGVAEGMTSNQPCSLNYNGPEPFSEPESRALRDFVLPRKDLIDMYLCLHSFGQFIMWPYGNGPIVPLPNQADVEAVAKAAKDAIYAKSGMNYTAGNAQQVLYTSSGTSRDWVAGVANVPLVYTYEFRPTINSKYMFFLPREFIRPNVEEFFAGVVAMVQKGKERGYLQFQKPSHLDQICKWAPHLCEVLLN